MLVEKLKHLIVKLTKKVVRPNSEKKKKKSQELKRMESDYQRTELPAKDNGQWIFFRWDALIVLIL